MKRLKPVDYQKLIKWLKRNRYRMTVFTMGGTSYIIVSLFSDGEISITGSTGVSIRVDATTWAHAMSFIENIREDRDTWKSASYARPNLVAPEIADNLNFGPSFPAICKAYWCYHSK